MTMFTTTTTRPRSPPSPSPLTLTSGRCCRINPARQPPTALEIRLEMPPSTRSDPPAVRNNWGQQPRLAYFDNV